MALYLESVQVDTITTLAGEVQTLTYSNIVVSNGQLTLRLEDVGGIDANVVINALVVTRLGADTSSPPRSTSAGLSRLSWAATTKC